MIEIRRTFNPDTGLGDVEQLRGYTFSSESFAHRFVIERTDGYGFEGYASAQFLRADGVKVRIADTETAFIDSDGNAAITLTPECYEVPGRFLLTIWHTVGSEKAVIYAATSTVLDTESADEVLSTRTVRTIESQVIDALGAAWSAAIFARNIGELEAEHAEILGNEAGILAALAEANVRALNTPNMIRYQPEGVTTNIPNGTVVTKYYTVPVEDATAAADPITLTFEDEAIEAGMVLHYTKSTNFAVVTNNMCTAVITAGQAVVTIAARSDAHSGTVSLNFYFCKRTTALLPYGEGSKNYCSSRPWLKNPNGAVYWGEERDEISERVVTLTGDDIISDTDGATYNTAVAFTVANAPGNNNCDALIFNYGNDGGSYTREVDDGNGGTTTETVNYGPSGVFDFVDGQTYTVSCWARVTNGSMARLVLGYGHNAHGYANYATDLPNHKYIDITNTTWERVSYSFVYRNTLSYIPGGASTAFTVTNKKRVAVGVCRKYDGTVQLAGFRLTAGALYGSNFVDTLTAQVEALTARVAALEALALENE